MKLYVPVGIGIYKEKVCDKIGPMESFTIYLWHELPNIYLGASNRFRSNLADICGLE